MFTKKINRILSLGVFLLASNISFASMMDEEKENKPSTILLHIRDLAQKNFNKDLILEVHAIQFVRVAGCEEVQSYMQSVKFSWSEISQAKRFSSSIPLNNINELFLILRPKQAGEIAQYDDQYRATMLYSLRNSRSNPEYLTKFAHNLGNCVVFVSEIYRTPTKECYINLNSRGFYVELVPVKKRDSSYMTSEENSRKKLAL